MTPVLSEEGFSDFLPGETIGQEFLYIFTWMWLGAIMGIAFGYLLAPLFLIVHKKVIGTQMIYGIQEIVDPTPDKFKGALKGFFPALMALNFAIIFSNNPVILDIINFNAGNQEDPVFVVLSVLTMLALTTGIATALFAPVWFLLDSGIVYSNKKKLEKRKLPHEVRSVGGWYIYILKGYAGIGVLFVFYEIISSYIAVESTNYQGIFLFIALPLLINILMIPSIVVLDLTENHRRDFILKFAKKIGIAENVEISFEEIN